MISNILYEGLNYVIKIPADMNNKEERYRLNFNKFTGIRKFEKYFNYVEWLNNGN